MNLKLECVTMKGTGVITATGELDVYSSPKLKSMLIDMYDEVANIIVDLSRIEFMDASGLGVLVGALKKMKNKGGCVFLVYCTEDIDKIFKITGLCNVFPIYDSSEREFRLEQSHIDDVLALREVLLAAKK